MDSYIRFFTQFFFGVDVILFFVLIIYIVINLWLKFQSNPKNANIIYFLLFLIFILYSTYLFIDILSISNQHLTNVGFSVNIFNVCLFFYTINLHTKLNVGIADSKPTTMLLFFFIISIGIYHLILLLFNKADITYKTVGTIDELIAALSTCISIYVTAFIVLFFLEERKKVLDYKTQTGIYKSQSQN
jgi:hypothetical protein